MSSAFPICESIGLKLVGGRLLPGPTGAAAAFYMYEALGRALHIYSAPALRRKARCATSMATASPPSIGWTTSVAYVVSGPADREQLEKVTKTVYEQIDKTGARKS